MESWRAPESIFAPIITAVPPGTDWAGFGNTLLAVTSAIPVAAVLYKVKHPGSFKRVDDIRDRRPNAVTGDGATPFTVQARLFDRPRGSTAPVDASAVLWEVGMTHLKDGLCTPAVPADFDSAILQMSRFRLSHEGLTGAPQLALLRHLWAEAVLAASPSAIVFGGQHHWHDDWWTEPILENVGTK